MRLGSYPTPLTLTVMLTLIRSLSQKLHLPNLQLCRHNLNHNIDLNYDPDPNLALHAFVRAEG